MGHGGGGMLSADLVRHFFLPAFSNDALLRLGDGAVFEVGGVRLAMSTDSSVVRPLFFPVETSASWPSMAQSTIWR